MIPLMLTIIHPSGSQLIGFFVQLVVEYASLTHSRGEVMACKYDDYRFEGDRYLELGYFDHAATAYTLASAHVDEGSPKHLELKDLIVQCQNRGRSPASSGVS